MTLIYAVIAATFAYLVSVLFTGELPWNLVCSLAAYSAVCSARRRPRLPIAVATVVGAATLSLSPFLLKWVRQPSPDEAARVRSRLRQVSTPLTGVDPGQGFEDLASWRSVFSGSRIVALGEASHGTSEFFRMKHRALEFFVTQMGFRHFFMEISQAAGERLNTWITGGALPPRNILWWPWNVPEVHEMFDWMRRYNLRAAVSDRIHVAGIDVRGDRDRGMAQNALRLLKEAGPAAKAVIWAHNVHVARPGMGRYLKESLGEDVYLLGFELNQGRFTSRFQTVQTYPVPWTGPSYYAYVLARTGHPNLFLDFKRASALPDVGRWLSTPHHSHVLQEIHAIFRLHPSWHTSEKPWPELYDGILFVEQSHPPRQ